MLNPEPMKSYSIESRCVCDVCGTAPALHISGEDPIKIVAKCHGETEVKMVTKRELTFTQRFFVSESDDGGDARN